MQSSGSSGRARRTSASSGCRLPSSPRKGLYLAVRELKVHYDSFVAYDDRLEIRCALTRLGRVALDVSYRVDNLTTGKLCVRGFSNMVAVEARGPGEPPALGRIRFDRAPFLPRVVSEEAFFA